MSYVDGTATLHISSISSLDQGEYCCQATNSAGFQVSKATLTVQSPTASEPTEPVQNGHAVAESNGHAATPLIADEVKPVEAPKEAVTAPVIRRDIESKIVKETETAILECEFDGKFDGEKPLLGKVTNLVIDRIIYHCRYNHWSDMA